MHDFFFFFLNKLVLCHYWMLCTMYSLKLHIMTMDSLQKFSCISVWYIFISLFGVGINNVGLSFVWGNIVTMCGQFL